MTLSRLQVLFLLLLLWIAPETQASALNPDRLDWIQDPPPPYMYLLGRDNAAARDQASSTSHDYTPDGIPDTWFRMYPRNLYFYLGRGEGYNVTHFILYTVGVPYRRWDTIPNSIYPLLQVEHAGRRVNRSNGSIAGFSLPETGMLDIYIGDDGMLALRHTPMIFEIHTLDGVYKMDIQPTNIWDNKPN
ncbi:MAG: hypothetical protein HQL50_05570 [Magnetococcales bacterium]|nr:hypothetical protein [Magnetococcales bacterium]